MVPNRDADNAAKFMAAFPWYTPPDIDKDTLTKWAAHMLDYGPLPGGPGYDEYDIERWLADILPLMDIAPVDVGDALTLRKDGYIVSAYHLDGPICWVGSESAIRFDSRLAEGTTRRGYLRALFRLVAMAGGDIGAYYDAGKPDEEADQRAADLYATTMSNLWGSNLHAKSYELHREFGGTIKGVFKDAVLIGYVVDFKSGTEPIEVAKPS